MIDCAQHSAEAREHGEVTLAHVRDGLLASERGVDSTPAGEPAPLSYELLMALDRAEGLSARAGAAAVGIEELREALRAEATVNGGAPDGPPTLARPTDLAIARARTDPRPLSTCDLLTAMSDDPRVARALMIAGVNPERLRNDLARACVDAEAAPTRGAGYTVAALAALKRAEGEAARAGRAEVEPIDLVLALLQADAPSFGELKKRHRLFSVTVRMADAFELPEPLENEIRRARGAPPPWSLRAVQNAPVTGVTVIAAVVITAAMIGGADVDFLVARAPMRWHELWRAVTSVFPHGGIIHLVFNIAWMWALGVGMERRHGRVGTAGFYIWSGYVASLGQLAVGGEGGIGLSGLLYGVAGYHWLYQRRRPGSAEVLSRGNAVLLFVWLFACIALTELGILAIANAAHFTGLFAGLAVAWLVTTRHRAAVGAVLILATGALTAWVLFGR